MSWFNLYDLGFNPLLCIRELSTNEHKNIDIFIIQIKKDLFLNVLINSICVVRFMGVVLKINTQAFKYNKKTPEFANIYESNFSHCTLLHIKRHIRLFKLINPF